MNLTPLLDFIAKSESRGNYNAVWGKIKPADRPKRLLVEMTIGEVLNWQDSIDRKYQSEAAGKYQILEDTLRGLFREAGLTLSDMFDARNQDRLGIALLNRRGLQRYLSGDLSAQDFANNIAKEWASMPVVSGKKKGRSYYAGDGLNKAHASVDDFLAAIYAVKSTGFVRPDVEPPVAPPAREVPASFQIGPLGWLLASLATLGAAVASWGCNLPLIASLTNYCGGP